MANILQYQYSNVFSDPTAINITEDNIKSTVSEPPLNLLQHIEFSTSEIIRAIDGISYYSATGPDKFPIPILNP